MKTPQQILVEEALDRINNECGWISVEERLPEEELVVLFIHPNGGIRTGKTIFYEGEFCMDQIQLCPIPMSEITHWMPLPPPPNK